MVTEEWKIIKDYPNYKVSSKGRVINSKFDRMLKQSFTGNGYLKVRLFNNNIGVTKTVHKLVTSAFIGEGVTNHLDYDKSNNDLSNLEICTYRQNSAHSVKRLNRYSKFIGVSFYKKNKKWSATIYIDGKNRFLGLFNTEMQAKEAYDCRLLTLNT